MELGAKVSVFLGDSVPKLRTFREAIASVDRTVQNASQGMYGLSSAFMVLAGTATLLTGAVTIVGAAGLQAAADYEQLEIAFTTLLGTVEKARAHLDELETFAANTPFEFMELAGASRRMKAMGFETEQVLPMLTVVGDAASAMGGDISDTAGRIIYALGQIKAKSRLMTQEMNQLTETGVFGWTDLARHLNTTVPKAMDMVEKRQVSGEQAISAFVAHSQAKFAGMMEAQSKTTLGRLSALRDEMNRTLRTTFMPVNDHLAGILQASIDIVKAAREIGPSFGEGMGEAVGHIGTVATMVKELVVGTKDLGDNSKTAAHWLGVFTVYGTLALLVMTPLLGVMAGLTMILAGVFMIGASPILFGMAVMGTLLGAMVPVSFALLGAFLLLREDGESFGETVTRWFDLMKAAMAGAWEELQKAWPFIRADLMPAFESLRLAVNKVMEALSIGSQPAQDEMKSLGGTIGWILGGLLQMAAFLFRVGAAIVLFGATIYSTFMTPIMGSINSIVIGFRMLFQEGMTLREGLVQIFVGVAALILTPFRMALISILEMAKEFANTTIGKKLLSMAGSNEVVFSKNADTVIAKLNNPLANAGARLMRTQDEMAAIQKKILEQDQRRQAANTAPTVNATVENKNEVTVKTTVAVDGKELGRATKKAEMDLQERAGFNQTPWQRRHLLEAGANPFPPL
jgi:hypothetical protein